MLTQLFSSNPIEVIQFFLAIGGAFFTLLATAGTIIWRLSRNFAKFQSKFEQIEAGFLRMEGANDENRKNILELTMKVSETKASFDALWLTLQRLFPDKVQPRLSDR
jgi:hypothetical protein